MILLNSYLELNATEEKTTNYMKKSWSHYLRGCKTLQVTRTAIAILCLLHIMPDLQAFLAQPGMLHNMKKRQVTALLCKSFSWSMKKITEESMRKLPKSDQQKYKTQTRRNWFKKAIDMKKESPNDHFTDEDKELIKELAAPDVRDNNIERRLWRNCLPGIKPAQRRKGVPRCIRTKRRFRRTCNFNQQKRLLMPRWKNGIRSDRTGESSPGKNCANFHHHPAFQQRQTGKRMRVSVLNR